jgi:hypothetical protein
MLAVLMLSHAAYDLLHAPAGKLTFVDRGRRQNAASAIRYLRRTDREPLGPWWCCHVLGFRVGEIRPFGIRVIGKTIGEARISRAGLADWRRLKSERIARASESRLPRPSKRPAADQRYCKQCSAPLPRSRKTFCGRACHVAYYQAMRTAFHLACRFCGKPFTARTGDRRYCSPNCGHAEAARRAKGKRNHCAIPPAWGFPGPLRATSVVGEPPRPRLTACGPSDH